MLTEPDSLLVIKRRASHLSITLGPLGVPLYVGFLPPSYAGLAGTSSSGQTKASATKTYQYPRGTHW